MSRLRTILTALAICGGIALIADVILSRPKLHPREDCTPTAHVYGADEPVACSPDSRPGPREPTEATTTRGIPYVVKPPTNYDPSRAHPLIVVYAPRTFDRFTSEMLVGLTREATAAGFVIAYADSRPLDMPTIEDLGTIPEAIAARWCIDDDRIYLTGHSDGGTVATATAILGKGRLRPAAIAPSAAGFRREDLDAYACPSPLGVMVQHGRNDELFPGFGREAAEWWATCNRCGAAPEVAPDGCLHYPDCAAGAETLYCEGDGNHGTWPERNSQMIAFFDRIQPPRQPAP